MILSFTFLQSLLRRASEETGMQVSWSLMYLSLDESKLFLPNYAIPLSEPIGYNRVLRFFDL